MVDSGAGAVESTSWSAIVEYGAPGGVSPTMTLPTVTEILHRREATTRDTFIADLRRATIAGPGPRRNGT